METKASKRPDCFADLFDAEAKECKQCAIATECETGMTTVASTKAPAEQKETKEKETKGTKETEEKETKTSSKKKEEKPAKEKSSKRGKAIDDETIKKIIAAVEGGKSYLAASKEFDVPQYKVRKLCQDAGVGSKRAKS